VAIFNADGSISFPALTTTNWENGTLTGPTLQLGNDPTVNEIIITGPTPTNDYSAARRLIIQGQAGYGGENNSKGEGGDVYIWAGIGGEGGSIDPRANGGDVKLRGGKGGIEGGYIRLESGEATATNGQGGFLDLNAGSSYNGGGLGGNVDIRAGQGTAAGGTVKIHTALTSTFTSQWTFGNDGKITFPNTINAPVGPTTQSFGMGNLFAWQDGNYWTIATGEPTTGYFGNTGIALSPGIESSTYLQLPSDFYANTAAVILSNVDSMGNVQIGANIHSWSFNHDGSTTLPGKVINSTVTTTSNSSVSTALDLTKTINKLSDNPGSWYTLDNGVEGQIMYLVPTTGTTNANTYVRVGNARVLNAAGVTTAAVSANIAFNPFGTYSSEQPTNVVTMIFTDGAWQSSGGSWD
jgi:hypothetical protein